MKKTFLLLSFILGCCALSAQESVQTLIKTLNNPKDSSVLVVAHRGDWRNAPENSLPAFANCILMNIDMIELDLKMTKDGHLIIMHDQTIDRTTNGHGKPTDYTLDEIREFRLKNGLGRVTNNKIPTLEEVLYLCKDKILINIDKGYDYFKEVYALTEKTATTNQVVIKSSFLLSKVQEENGEVLNKVIYMPIINLDRPEAEKMLEEYLAVKPVAIECCFKEVTPQVIHLFEKIKSSGIRIWINSLWASLNAGHDDDMAVEENKPDESWGWILNQGATLIQTDRPVKLMEYLNLKNRRNCTK